MSIAVRNFSGAYLRQYQIAFWGSKACRTVRRYLYFPNKLGLTVFYTLN